jgi:uncharacterized membrane protein YhaH (DUF805 family)
MSDNFLWLLFSFRGRINRATFAAIFFAQFFLGAIFQFFVLRRYMAASLDAVTHKVRLALDAPPPVIGVLCFLGLVSAWVSLANPIKRLHDFGCSGWWLLAPVGAMLAGLAAGAPFFLLHLAVVGAILLEAAALATVVGGSILVAMMFFRPGDEGENGHPRGPDERATRRAFAAAASRQAPAADASSPARGLRRPAAQSFGRRGLRA